MTSRNDKEREEDDDDDDSSIFSDFCVCEPSPPFTLPMPTPTTLFHLVHQQKEAFSALSPVDRHGRSVLQHQQQQQQYPYGHAVSTFSPRSPYSTNGCNRRSSAFTPSPLQAIGLKAHHAIPILPFGTYGPYHTGGVQGRIGGLGGTAGTPMDCMTAMRRTSQSRDALQQMFATSSSSNCRKRRGSQLSTLSSSTADLVGSGEHGGPPSVVIVTHDADNEMGTASIQSNSETFPTKMASSGATLKEAPFVSASFSTTPHAPKKHLSEQDYLQLHREYKEQKKSRRHSALSASVVSVAAAAVVSHQNSVNLAMISPQMPNTATTTTTMPSMPSLSSLTYDTSSNSVPATTTCGTLTEEQYLHLHMHNMQVQPDTGSAGGTCTIDTRNPEFGDGAKATLGSPRMSTLKRLVPSSAIPMPSPSHNKSAPWVSPLYISSSRKTTATATATPASLFQPNDPHLIATFQSFSPHMTAMAATTTAQRTKCRNSSYSSFSRMPPAPSSITASVRSTGMPNIAQQNMMTRTTAAFPPQRQLMDRPNTSTSSRTRTSNSSPRKSGSGSRGAHNLLVVPNLWHPSASLPTSSPSARTFTAQYGGYAHALPLPPLTVNSTIAHPIGGTSIATATTTATTTIGNPRRVSRQCQRQLVNRNCHSLVVLSSQQPYPPIAQWQRGSGGAVAGHRRNTRKRLGMENARL